MGVFGKCQPAGAVWELCAVICVSLQVQGAVWELCAVTCVSPCWALEECGSHTVTRPIGRISGKILCETGW